MYRYVCWYVCLDVFYEAVRGIKEIVIILMIKDVIVISLFKFLLFEGVSHEEKWLNVLFLTEGEARVGNITFRPRPKAEVLMQGYHNSELVNRILQRPSV